MTERRQLERPEFIQPSYQRLSHGLKMARRTPEQPRSAVHQHHFEVGVEKEDRETGERQKEGEKEREKEGTTTPRCRSDTFLRLIP